MVRLWIASGLLPCPELRVVADARQQRVGDDDRAGEGDLAGGGGQRKQQAGAFLALGKADVVATSATMARISAVKPAPRSR
jgi:hypothetical protein